MSKTETAGGLTGDTTSLGVDTPVEKFREFLEIRGDKLTEPRRVLVRHIFNTHKHFDADELVRDLHDAGQPVSRSTVYRTLRLLVDSGLLRELRLTNRTAFEHDYGYPVGLFSFYTLSLELSKKIDKKIANK